MDHVGVVCCSFLFCLLFFNEDLLTKCIAKASCSALFSGQNVESEKNVLVRVYFQDCKEELINMFSKDRKYFPDEYVMLYFDKASCDGYICVIMDSMDSSFDLLIDPHFYVANGSVNSVMDVRVCSEDLFL
jgi:hypothetical protein